MITITDNNYRQFIDARCGWKYRDEPIPYARMSNIPRIPQSEWKAIQDRKIATKTTNKDLFLRMGMKIKNQGQTPLCWMFATTSAAEYARALANLPYISLSPASCAAPITGWRARGGWGGEGIKFLTETGAVPTSQWADTSFDRNLNNNTNNAVRQNFRALETERLNPNEQDVVSALLQGFAITGGYNWWTHQVLLLDPIFNNSGQCTGIEIANSWGTSWSSGGFGILARGKMVPNDAIIIREMVPYEG